MINMKKRGVPSNIRHSKRNLTTPVDIKSDSVPEDKLDTSLDENTKTLKSFFGDSFDLLIKNTTINGINAVFAALDGMYNALLASSAIIKPVSQINFACTEAAALMEYIKENVVWECDIKTSATIADACERLISGCMLLFLDGADYALAFSVQGYPKRGVEKPDTETQENGSEEGFADMFKDNVTLVRRRIKTPFVRFETTTVGKAANCSVCICYHAKRANSKIVESVKKTLDGIKLDIVPGSAALRPFFEGRRLSFFSCVGTTERPDVFAAKISEGKVGLIVDGTPHALILPYLFIEHFHTLDDYLSRPYYTLVARMLKIISFFVAIFLPGIYVAVGTFHQEIFPSAVIYEIFSSIQNTPFPLVVESLVIHFIYEIVREAGLRMPKSLGHTVSIVGTLVIGDAAVRAGLVCAPMLIVLAITTVCSSVVPSLHEPSSVLRLIFIILGGVAGLYGIMLGFLIVITDICSLSPFGIPYTSPLSPFDIYASRDSVAFFGWKNVGGRFMSIQNLRGSEHNE